uniref:C2H2-type domain-containing protein n=1 Tax=Timema genevievae TaxID=629358 RepID=A0A7R9JPE2_TIMGE|nr:unnamed protein product [Timema genevievae]
MEPVPLKMEPLLLKMKPAEICEEPKLDIHEEEEIQKAMEDTSKHFLEGSDDEISSRDSYNTQQEKNSNSLLHEPDRSSLKKHLERHTGNKPHKCFWCGKNFFLKSTLKQHELVHTGDNPYKCKKCGASFNHRRKLYAHRSTHQ